jgi:hypothetical protein
MLLWRFFKRLAALRSAQQPWHQLAHAPNPLPRVRAFDPASNQTSQAPRQVWRLALPSLSMQAFAPSAFGPLLENPPSVGVPCRAPLLRIGLIRGKRRHVTRARAIPLS